MYASRAGGANAQAVGPWTVGSWKSASASMHTIASDIACGISYALHMAQSISGRRVTESNGMTKDFLNKQKSEHYQDGDM